MVCVRHLVPQAARCAVAHTKYTRLHHRFSHLISIQFDILRIYERRWSGPRLCDCSRKKDHMNGLARVVGAVANPSRQIKLSAEETETIIQKPSNL